jgi:CubicO group peptidase (beta-lactamase class C family)
MLDSSLLTTFRQSCAEKRLHVYGVDVYQEGQGSTRHLFRANDRVHLWSASKTFTSLAVGMCVNEGRFSLSDRALELMPEFRPIAADGSDAITIRDMLHMASGKEYDLFQETDEHVCNDTDWMELWFAGEQVTEPGTHFRYSTGCTYAIGRLVEAVSGLTVRDYLMPRLFEPLDILNPWWVTCPRGHSSGGFGLYLTIDEFAKLGRLLLNEGLWDDRALVPTSYVAAMRDDTIDSSMGFDGPDWQVGYGYQVWRNRWPGSYRADGMYGQLCVVVPDRQAAVTITGHNELNVQGTLDAIFEDIVATL